MLSKFPVDFPSPTKLHQSNLITPSITDRENNPEKSFWTGTKRLNSSHFISETGKVSSFNDELYDWQNFLPAVQLEGTRGLKPLVSTVLCTVDISDIQMNTD